MKKLLALLTAAVGAAAAFAATPVAVWDEDFSTANLAQNGWTLVNWNETHAADWSTVTIDRNNQGLMINSDSGNSGITVLVKYSGLSASSSANRVLAASCATATHQYDRTGITLKSNGTLVGLWNASTTANSDTDNGTASGSIASSGVMAFTYGSGGTYLYYGSNTGSISATAAWGSAGLKAGADSSNSSIYGAAIGGMCDGASRTGYEAAIGMTISGIAVFNTVLSNAEMKSYVWPSEAQMQQIVVNNDTTVSAINNRFDPDSYKSAKVTVASGVTITVDAAFSAKIKSVSSTGSITLAAASQPDASYLANVDFSGVQGGLLRSWLTPGVVGVNFAKNYGNDVSSELVASDSWVETTGASGSSTALFADGLTKITWSSSNDYSYNARGDTESAPFIYGYLDDGANKGNGVEVTIECVPYETYDVVIYASTDTSSAHFQTKTVNGTTYTVDSSGNVTAGNAVWGSSRLNVPDYGQNAMRIKNLSGTLTIYGGLNTYSSNGARGGIAAIQIMPTTAADNVKEYTLALDGAATDWSTGAWKIGTETVAAPLSGNATITLSQSTTLTIDETVALSRLVVQGSNNAVLTLVTGTGSLVANISTTVKSGVLQQGSASVLGATPMLVVEDGATFDMNGQSISGSTTVYIAGSGAGNWPWALTSSSAASGNILGGLYLSDDATIGGANEIKIGQTGAGYHLYLQGHTLTKTGAGAFTGTNMNTPGTGTIEVQGGAMSVNQWNNLNNSSGNTTVILNSGTSLANGTDRIVPMSALGLYGGTLLTASKAFKVNTALRGAGETANLAFASGVSALLTGDLTVTATLTLDGNATFLKDAEAVNDVVVTPALLTAASGTITVGSGVTLNLGVNRPVATITVQEGGTLAAQMQNASDVIALATSAQPANVILYDANGNAVSNPRVTYSNGTLTIMPPVPTLEASGTVAFDTASNWVDSTMPGNGGDAIIELSDDAEITVSGTYALGSLTITGSGVATFSGNGTITADNISVKNGATLSRNANISATTGISLDSGTVLKLDGVTESAVISGAGAVETYGTVVLAGANSFTGGITAKTGTLSTTHQSGYAGSGADGSPSIVVEDGACVDLANTANYGHTLTIAGKGVLLADGTYSGAVKNSGAAMGEGTRQTKSLTLTADAMVDVSSGWGLVRSGYGAAVLALNGHTLTMRGTGTVPMVKVNTESTTTGTLVMDGATLFLAYYQSNLTGVNVIIKGAANVNLSEAPSAIGSLTLKPAASGTTATNWNLPSGCVPSLDTSNIDQSGLSNGQVLTLFTAPSGTTLSSENISVTAGGRFTTTISGNTVTATFSAGIPQPFLHYDFNNGAAVDTGKASDSKTQIYAFGEASGATFAPARDGSAVNVYASGYTAYWDTNISGVSPFAAGEASVTAVAKMKETGVILWGLGNTNNRNPALGLVVSNSTTAAVYARNEDGSVEEVVVVSGAKDLTKGYHFFAVVANANGTTLYVDGLSDSSDKVISFAIGQQGQFGSFHGGAIGARKVGAEGFYLDDWRVYDAALTPDEVKTLRKQFVPPPLFIRIR